MRASQRLKAEKGCFEIIEEATHLLRTAPAGALASYFVGTLPFVLGFLYFWMDMARSPFAGQHLAGAALGLSVLFLWMKVWQVVFLRQLRSVLSGVSPEPLSVGGCLWILVTQTVLQPSGLFVQPLALIPALPWPWVYAFYNNLSVLGDRQPGQLRNLIKAAARQAALWPRQNNFVLLALTGFGFCVLLNWITVCFLLPHLAKMLFGLESVVTRNPLALLNTTFFAAMLGLTYLSVDPLAKAVYCVRCFYGESRQSGEDLKAELRTLSSQAPARAFAMMFVVALFCCGTRILAAQETPTAALAANSATSVRVSPPALDQAIHEVIHQDKFAWRAPRVKLVKPEVKEEGVIRRFLRRAWGFIKEGGKSFSEWLGRVLRRLFGGPASPSGGYGLNGWSLQVLLYALIAALVVALLWLLYHGWRARRTQIRTTASEPIEPAPDLNDPSVGADELPGEEWTRLARDLALRGEYRLALRAFYLSSLAHLATRNLISLARFKSNRDYERELRRRAHAFPALLTLFAENVSVFDRVWYGWHQIDGQLLSQFAAKVEAINSGATA